MLQRQQVSNFQEPGTLSSGGTQTALTSGQFVRKLKVADELGSEKGESRRQLRRYIHLQSFFPPNTSLEDMEREIYAALAAYRKNDTAPASS